MKVRIFKWCVQNAAKAIAKLQVKHPQGPFVCGVIRYLGSSRAAVSLGTIQTAESLRRSTDSEVKRKAKETLARLVCDASAAFPHSLCVP